MFIPLGEGLLQILVYVFPDFLTMTFRSNLWLSSLRYPQKSLVRFKVPYLGVQLYFHKKVKLICGW